MKYQDFTNSITFGNYTAFVYDSPNNRYVYSAGDITDDTFANTNEETDFNIVPINDFPRVKEVIIDNFLPEIAPASNVQDDGYDEVKRLIESGEAQIGYWDDQNIFGVEDTTYMLIL